VPVSELILKAESVFETVFVTYKYLPFKSVARNPGFMPVLKVLTGVSRPLAASSLYPETVLSAELAT
jgi:hypothetical protein